MKVSETKRSTEKPWMTVDDLAAYLDLSKSTIYKKIMLRKIPYYKVEGSLFFKREDIDAWIASRKVDAFPATL